MQIHAHPLPSYESIHRDRQGRYYKIPDLKHTGSKEGTLLFPLAENFDWLLRCGY